MQWISMLGRECKKKAWFILLAACIVSILMALEVYYSDNRIIESGRVHLEKTIVVNFNSDVPGLKNNFFDRLFQSYTEINLFIDEASSTVDFSKLDANWNKLHEREKYEWIQRHFFFNKMSDGIYQIVFVVDTQDPKNMEYISTNKDVIVSTYERFVINRLKTIDNNLTVNTMGSVDLLGSDTIIEEKPIKSYAAVGFVLGGLIGVTLLGLNIIRVKMYDRK